MQWSDAGYRKWDLWRRQAFTWGPSGRAWPASLMPGFAAGNVGPVNRVALPPAGIASRRCSVVSNSAPTSRDGLPVRKAKWGTADAGALTGSRWKLGSIWQPGVASSMAGTACREFQTTPGLIQRGACIWFRRYPSAWAAAGQRGGRGRANSVPQYRCLKGGQVPLMGPSRWMRERARQSWQNYILSEFHRGRDLVRSQQQRPHCRAKVPNPAGSRQHPQTHRARQ